jgi:hypothetical protein
LYIPLVVSSLNVIYEVTYEYSLFLGRRTRLGRTE